MLGRKFIIRIDHQALKWLNNCIDPSSRLMRLRLMFEEYEYTIEYVKGKDNPVVDSLSRIHAIQKVETPEGTVVLDFLQHFTEWKKKSEILKRL